MQVARIIEQKGDRVVSTAPDVTVQSIAHTLAEERVGAALVQADNGDMLGIISERDIVHGIANRGPETLALPASELMTRDVITCDPDTDVEELMEKMLSARIRHLPVIREGELLAVVSIGDLVAAVVKELRWMRSTLQEHLVASAGWSTEEDPEG